MTDPQTLETVRRLADRYGMTPAAFADAVVLDRAPVDLDSVFPALRDVFRLERLADEGRFGEAEDASGATETFELPRAA